MTVLLGWCSHAYLALPVFLGWVCMLLKVLFFDKLQNLPEKRFSNTVVLNWML